MIGRARACVVDWAEFRKAAKFGKWRKVFEKSIVLSHIVSPLVSGDNHLPDGKALPAGTKKRNIKTNCKYSPNISQA